MKTSARSRVAPARHSELRKAADRTAAGAVPEDTPLLTVIVPVYNEAETIDQEGQASQRDAPPKAGADVDPNDLICGPRCVQYVLRYYRQEADLIELTREIQWPDLEAGASLELMDKVLRERGIHTFGIQVAPQARLKWPYPAIVHVSVDEDKVGHFVVWLPTSRSDMADLWCGLRGVQQVSDRELAARRSGAVLLTSPQQITEPGSAVKPSGPTVETLWISGAGLAGFLVLLGFCVWLRTMKHKL